MHNPQPEETICIKTALRSVPFGIFLFFMLPGGLKLAYASRDTGSVKKKWAFHGTLGVSMQLYSTSNSNSRMRPFTYTLTGSPVLTLWGKQVPMTVIISEQDRRFIQPYNQIGISPRGKWFTLHFGHRNIYFSNYTLAGTTILGAGFDMNPGKFRMGVMGGQINRAVTTLDLIRNPAGFTVGGKLQYQRWGYCGKIGIGKENRFIDFIFFQGWDRKGSVSEKMADSIGITPSENIAFGINSKLPLSKRVFWEVDAAISSFTGDSREASNSSGVLQKLYPARFSSQVFTAARTAINYMGTRFGLRAEYKRVDPEYKTMGMYFIQSDIQQVTLSPNFGLFKSKVRVSGSVGIENDNLLKNRESTTNRLIYSTALSWSPGKGNYGMDLNYSNFGITQSPGLRPVNDTIRIAQNNSSYGMNHRYSFKTKTKLHSILVMAMYQELTDLNIFTSAMQENNSKIGNITYSNSPLKKGFGYTTSLTYSDFLQNSFAYTLVGGAASVSYMLKNNKMQTNLMGSYQANLSAGTVNGGVVNVALGANLMLTKKHSVSARCTFLNSSNSKIVQQNYRELIGQFDYRFSF